MLYPAELRGHSTAIRREDWMPQLNAGQFLPRAARLAHGRVYGTGRDAARTHETGMQPE